MTTNLPTGYRSAVTVEVDGRRVADVFNRWWDVTAPEDRTGPSFYEHFHKLTNDEGKSERQLMNWIETGNYLGGSDFACESCEVPQLYWGPMAYTPVKVGNTTRGYYACSQSCFDALEAVRREFQEEEKAQQSPHRVVYS